MECARTDLDALLRTGPTSNHPSTGLSPRQALEPAHARELFIQLLRGLDHCHTRGVVHRNIKPAQILIDGVDEDVVKICGFSHACLLSRGGASEPRQRSDAGTLWYRAPESLLGLRNTTTACDIWAAATILVEMLTGTPLFSGCSSEIGTH